MGNGSRTRESLKRVASRLFVTAWSDDYYTFTRSLSSLASPFYFSFLTAVISDLPASVICRFGGGHKIYVRMSLLGTGNVLDGNGEKDTRSTSGKQQQQQQLNESSLESIMDGLQSNVRPIPIAPPFNKVSQPPLIIISTIFSSRHFEHSSYRKTPS